MLALEGASLLQVSVLARRPTRHWPKLNSWPYSVHQIGGEDARRVLHSSLVAVLSCQLSVELLQVLQQRLKSIKTYDVDVIGTAPNVYSLYM